MAKPVDLSAENFEEEALKSETPVLVDFWSPSCPHCLRLGPDFDEAAEGAEGRVKFAKVSVQDARPLFAQHLVNAVPTLVLFRDGKEVARQEGARTPDEILSWVDENV